MCHYLNENNTRMIEIYYLKKHKNIFIKGTLIVIKIT